jgi:hypothetical protein
MAIKIGAFNEWWYRIAIAAAGGAHRSPVNPSPSEPMFPTALSALIGYRPSLKSVLEW